jgi:hypothetical protein
MQIQGGVLLIALGDRLSDGQGGPDCSLGVVLVGARGPEQRHHGVADELLHRAAIALQVGPKSLVVGGQQPSNILHIQPF